MFISKKKTLTLLCITISILMITPTVFSQNIKNNTEEIEKTDKISHKLTVPLKKTDLYDENNPKYTLNSNQNSPENWWNTSWQYRKKIIIEKENIPEDFTNFSVLVDIPSDTDLRDHCQNNGEDIVFATEEKDKLYHEIELFNNTDGKLLSWVKLNLDNENDNVFYIYYGNPSCHNQENTTMTWDKKYVLVQHLSEKTGSFYDSTAYDNNGSYCGESQDVVGKIDGAASFDGIDDIIDFGNDSSLDLTGQITIQTWVYYSEKNNVSTIVEKNNSYKLSINSSGKLVFDAFFDNEEIEVPFNVSIEKEKWSYVVLTYQNNSGHEIKLYVDGELKETNDSFQGLVKKSSKNVLFGNSFDGDNCLNGSLDEIRIYNGVLDDSWIETEFLNINTSDSFVDISSEESLNNIYQVSNLAGNETHPAVSVDEDGNIFAAYESDNDGTIKWVKSEDNGKTWKKAFDFDIETGFETNPAVDYWDYNRFYATLEPPEEDNYGGTIYLIKYNLKGEKQVYTAENHDHEAFPDSDPDWYGIKDVDIACDSSQNSHEFGVISFVASTNAELGPVVNGPHIFYNVPEDEKNVSIVWEPKYSNCANSSIDIDDKTHKSYSIYEWHNKSKSKLILMMFDFANPPDNDLGYNDIIEIENASDLKHPSVASYNDSVLIVSEKIENGKRDIICSYSKEGFDTETFSNSVVVNTTDNETNPVIKWVKENTYICTFSKNGNLYISKSMDGGVTWSQPVFLNDKEGSVVKDYQSFDLSKKGQKIIWADNRDDNINVFIGDTGVELPKKPAKLKIVGISGGYAIDTHIYNIGEIAAEDITWKVNVTGKRIFGRNNTFEEKGSINYISGGYGTDLRRIVVWGLGPISITVSLSASNAESVSYSRSGFLFGGFIFLKIPRVKVSGKIYDEDTDEEIGLTRVKAKSVDGFFSRTDRSNLLFNKGYYELFLKPGTYNFTLSRIGYKSYTETVRVKDGVVRVIDFKIEKR